MSICLQVSAGSAAPVLFEHGGPTIRVGRDPAGELVLGTDGPSRVSWNHARIDVSPAGALLSDLKSTNGTLRNGSPIQTPTPLTVGDTIQFGIDGPVARVLAVPGAAYGPAGTVAAPAGLSAALAGKGGLPAYRSPTAPGPLPAFAPAAPRPTGLPAFASATGPGGAPALQPGPVPARTPAAQSATRLLLVSMQNRWRRTALVAGALVAVCLTTLAIYTWKHEERLGGIDAFVRRADTHFGRLDDAVARQLAWNEQADATFDLLERDIRNLNDRADKTEAGLREFAGRLDAHAADTARQFAQLRATAPPVQQSSRAFALPTAPVPQGQPITQLPEQPAQILINLKGRPATVYVDSVTAKMVGRFPKVSYKRPRIGWNMVDAERVPVIATQHEVYAYDFEAKGYRPALTHYTYDPQSQALIAQTQPAPGRNFFKSLPAVMHMDGVDVTGCVSLGSSSWLNISIAGRGPQAIPVERIQRIDTANGLYYFDAQARGGIVFVPRNQVGTNPNFADAMQTIQTLSEFVGNLAYLIDVIKK